MNDKVELWMSGEKVFSTTDDIVQRLNLFILSLFVVVAAADAAAVRALSFFVCFFVSLCR